MKFVHGLRGEHVKPALDWLREHKSPVMSDIYEFGIYVGLRVSDLAGITTQEAKQILISGVLDDLEQSKTGKKRLIDLNDNARGVLIRRIERAELFSKSFIFFSESNRAISSDKPLNRKSVNNAMTAVQDFINLTYGTRYNLGSHTMRKTMALKVYRDSGNDLVLTRDILQHHNTRITEAYLGLDRSRVNEAVHAMDFGL